MRNVDRPTDKREIARTFRARLRALVERQPGGLTGFARRTGVDRSALTQFVAEGAARLPRAETLCRIATACEVTADWLLGLAHAEDAPPALTPSVEIERAVTEDGTSPLERWHREAAGHKIRYVPSALPDMLLLPQIAGYGVPAGQTDARRDSGAAALETVRLGETDIELALPRQRLEAFAAGHGPGEGVTPALRRAQLDQMARLADAHYPTLRLHLYDERRTYAAPFTVFGPVRAAVYLGPGYLVLTSAEEVRRLARIFDGLVRQAVVGPDRMGGWLRELASGIAD